MPGEQKKYEDLTITDDFMFGKVMHHPERCRKLLELILDINIRKVEFLDKQKAMNPDYEARGIRLDIYLEDVGNTVYNVEMQAKNEGDLPERSRYYQSVIDINLIEKGEDLRKLLTYFESLVPQDAYTRELDEAVTAAKEHKEWRREYMKLEVLKQRSRREGRTEGNTEKLASQIHRKIIKGKTPEQIAEDLEEELSEVKRIYDVVAKYLPDYDQEKILAELFGY